MKQYYVHELTQVLTEEETSFSENSNASEIIREWENQVVFDGINYFTISLGIYGLDRNSLAKLLQTQLGTSNKFSSNLRFLTANKANQLYSEVQQKAPVELNVFSTSLIHGFNEIITFLEGNQFSNLSSNEINILTDSFFDALHSKLLFKLEKVKNLEFLVFCEEQDLEPNDSESHVYYSTECLSNKNYIDYLIQEYPLLFRLAREQVDFLCKNFKVFITRLNTDYEQVLSLIDAVDGKIVALESNLSDPRTDQNSVHIITFDKGQKLAYKPWSIKLQEAYNTLIKKMAIPLNLNFPISNTIAKDNYGWMEFVKPKPDLSKNEVLKSGYQTGCLLGILYVLDAIDFHLNNIIYSSQGPVVIDCETLFQCDTFLLGNTVVENVYEDYSVMEIGLLNSKSLEKMSFLSAANRKEFVDSIEQGFEKCYHFFLENSEKMYIDICQLFEFSLIRILVRKNEVYTHLIEQRLSPEVLTHGYKSDMLFDWLWGYVPKMQHLKPLLRFEKDALFKEHVPFFYTFFDSSNIFFESKKVGVNYLFQPAKARLKNKFQKMNVKDLEFQKSLISNAFH